jgi:hypothetical protein
MADPDVYALAVLDALAEGDDDTAAALLAEADPDGEGGGDDTPDEPTTPDQPTPDTALKALSLPPRVMAAVELHRRADDAGRAELVRLAAEDPDGYERLVDDAVADMLFRGHD